MEIQERKLSEIIPYENNPRHNAEAVDKVAASLQEFGWQQPIVVDTEGIVIAGHTRLKAAQKLGLETAPVIVAEDLTEEQVKAYRLADNKTAEFSGWDFDLLNAEIFSIDQIDMSQFGFDVDAAVNLDEEIQEDDYKPEPPKEPISKLGDIWKLGDHILICGDATNAEDLLKIVNRGGADLLITDPPYNVDYTGKTKDALKIQNDRKDDADFRRFLIDAFKASDSCMKQGAAFYIWHADSEGYNFRGACSDTGWKVRQCLIWNKNVFVMGRQDYQWKHEPCLYGWKEGKAHYFINIRNEETVISDSEEINPKKMKKDELIQLVTELMEDKIRTTVINEDRPTRSEDHPTMKPIKLIARLIKNSSKAGWVVLDPFGGSGTTLMACEQLNRKCRMVELDPRYCDVIIDRWEKFTGRKAERWHEETEKFSEET